MRFRVKTRRLGLRRVDKALVFDLSVVAAEAEGEETRRDVRVVSPVPLVLLPGLGNEQSPSSMEAFVPALQLEAAGYDGEGKRPNLIVHGYDSLTTSLPALGKTLNRPVRRLLRKTPFTRVDIVGFSMGGLVARSYMAGRRGAGKVRKCLFLATPNEGTPLAYLGAQLTDLPLLDGVPALGGIADLLLDPEAKEALRVFYPTYPWLVATVPILGTVPLDELLPESDSLLAALSDTAPDPDCSYHGIAYSELGAAGLGLGIGTVDTVDLTALLGSGAVDIGELLAGNVDILSLLTSGDLDLTLLASGEGDGLVPSRSVFMDDEPAWRDRITRHDMGAGTHLTMLLDPAVVALVAEILAAD
jgi:pimeloyl-ACP methyl ester carboxylesterase